MYKLELEVVVIWDVLSAQWLLPPHQGWRLIPSCLHPSCSYSLLMFVFPSLCTQTLNPEMGEWWRYGGPCCLLTHVGYIQRSKLYSLCMHACMYAKSLQLCPTQCNSMDCRPPGSSVHGILQARILECVAMPSSRVCSQPRNLTHISCISCTAGWFFIAETLGKTMLSVQFPIIVFLTLISLSLRCKPLCPSQPITAPTLYHNCLHMVMGHSYPHPVPLCDMEWLGPERSLTLIWSTCQGGLEKHGNP